MRKTWEDRAAFVIAVVVTLMLILGGFVSEISLDTAGKTLNIAESLAVIASVVYVGYQVRMGTKAIKSATYQNIVASFAAISSRVSESKELAEIYLKGRNGGQLADVEQLRFNQVMSSFFDVHESLYYQYREGLLDHEFWLGWHALLRLYLRRPGSRKWWEGSKDRFSDGFRNYVETVKESEPIDHSGFLVDTSST